MSGHSSPLSKREQFLQQIEQQYADHQLTVTALAAQNHMERSTYHRHFKKLMWISPGRYLQSYRLQQAKQLLTEGISVARTANACGYQDASYFARIFRKRFHCTPSAYASHLQQISYQVSDDLYDLRTEGGEISLPNMSFKLFSNAKTFWQIAAPLPSATIWHKIHFPVLKPKVNV